MHTDGIWFKDAAGRALLLRGANLGGSNKVPTRPNGATYIRDGFFEHRDVSFVGRPFPLEEADEHFSRLRAWGLTFLRLLRPHHFVREAGHSIDFPNEYLKPFARRFTDAIRAVHPEALIFLEGVPHRGHSRWGAGDPPQVVNAAHWYDTRTLITKHFDRDVTNDWATGQVITGIETADQREPVTLRLQPV